MNGKKGIMEATEIDIDPPNLDCKSSNSGKQGNHVGLSLKQWCRSVWEFAKEDRNRVTFSIKVGIAVLLVALLILIPAPYRIFGANAIWSVITVAIMFEYTVGATFNRGFNRALGSVCAGVIAIALIQVIMHAGRIAEPIIIGFSIFVVGAVTSFMKQWPSLAPYEYGFRVMLFTFCLLLVSGYRVGNPLRMAVDRLYSIAIGGMVALLVNVLLFPVWAGQQLHDDLAKCFHSLADSLEECVRKYVEDDGLEPPEFSKTVDDEFADEPAFRRFRSMLASSAKFELLANSARWEPPHGKFKQFVYPWSEYVKVGAVVRHCAYEVMAMHGVLHSEIQAPHKLRMAFQSEIQDASSQAAELVRSLGKDIQSMKYTLQASLLKRVHASTERLQRSIHMHSYLFTPGDCTCKPTPTKLATNVSNLKKTSAELGSAKNTPLYNPDPICTFSASSGSYHETMRKQQRRLYSWPSREVDEFREEKSVDMDLIPKMEALESTTTLSLATFTSLLIEFVARLDHLVEAVNKLATMAMFKNNGIS